MIGSVRLGNKRKSSPHQPEPGDVVIAIDRPNVLCNPYPITEKRTRARAIEMFRKDLDNDVRLRRGPRYAALCEIVERVLAGDDVILMCWCCDSAGTACHGDVIKEIVERLVRPPALKLERRP